MIDVEWCNSKTALKDFCKEHDVVDVKVIHYISNSCFNPPGGGFTLMTSVEYLVLYKTKEYVVLDKVKK